MWDVIEYEEVMEPVILGIVNDLNEQYMYAKWTADDDFTVTASMDVLLRPNEDTGEILLQAVRNLVNIVDACYPELAPYAK